MNTPSSALAGQRVLLADVGQRRSPVIRLELIRLRCQLLGVTDLLEEPDSLPNALERMRPDLLLVDSAEPSSRLLETLAQAQQEQPRAVLLAAESASPEQMRQALRAGVSCIELGGLPPQRLGAVLQLTLIHFEHNQHVQHELHQVQTQLAERKLIERARGILMREQTLDEEAAFQRLRQLAMDGGQTLAMVSQRLIDASQLLRTR